MCGACVPLSAIGLRPQIFTARNHVRDLKETVQKLKSDAEKRVPRAAHCLLCLLKDIPVGISRVSGRGVRTSCKLMWKKPIRAQWFDSPKPPRLASSLVRCAQKLLDEKERYRARISELSDQKASLRREFEKEERKVAPAVPLVFCFLAHHLVYAQAQENVDKYVHDVGWLQTATKKITAYA